MCPAEGSRVPEHPDLVAQPPPRCKSSPPFCPALFNLPLFSWHPIPSPPTPLGFGGETRCLNPLPSFSFLPLALGREPERVWVFQHPVCLLPTRAQFSKYGTEELQLPALARTGLVPCGSNPGVFSPGSKHVSGVSDTQSIYWNLRGTVLVPSQARILFRVSPSSQGPCLREDLCQAGAQKPLHSRKPSRKGRQAFLGL